LLFSASSPKSFPQDVNAAFVKEEVEEEESFESLVREALGLIRWIIEASEESLLELSRIRSRSNSERSKGVRGLLLLLS